MIFIIIIIIIIELNELKFSKNTEEFFQHGYKQALVEFALPGNRTLALASLYQILYCFAIRIFIAIVQYFILIR